MISRNMLRHAITISAVGALACSEHGTNALLLPAPSAAMDVSGITTPDTTTLVVSIDSGRIFEGGTARAVATVRDGHGIVEDAVLKWSSSDEDIAPVAATGIVSGVATGTATIIATYGSVSGSVNITVTPPAVSSVVVSLGSSALVVGAHVKATATLRDDVGEVLTGRTVDWTSSAPSVATVSAAGVVRAIAPGTAVIGAESESKAGRVTIRVSGVGATPVASVTIAIPLSVLPLLQTTQAAATLRDAAGNVLTGRSVTWSSSAPRVASVSPTGLILGLGAGATDISATSEGVVTSAPVTVGVPALRSVSFDGYANTAALLADCVVFDCIEQKLTDDAGVPGFAAGNVSLDNAANPPGATKAMRYHYVHPGDGCNSITLTHSIRFAPRQEVWAEFVVKWSANFTTRNDACIPNDHKFIFGDTQAAANGRWALYVGSDFYPYHTIKQEVAQSPDIVPGNYYLNRNKAPSELFAENLWNGTWHTIRLHMKASSTGVTRDGAYQIWIDGVLRHDQRGFATTRNDGTNNPDFIEGFSFARNQDDGPPGLDMYVWWGAIRVFGANPGW